MNIDPNPFFERITPTKDEIAAAVNFLTEASIKKATKEMKDTDIRTRSMLDAMLPLLDPVVVRPPDPPGALKNFLEMQSKNFLEMRSLLADYDADLERFITEKIDNSLRVIGPPYDAKWYSNDSNYPESIFGYANEQTGEFGIQYPYEDSPTQAGIGFYIKALKRNLVMISAHMPINYSWWYLVRTPGGFASLRGFIDVEVYDVTGGGHKRIGRSQEGNIFNIHHTNPGHDEELFGSTFLTHTEAAYTYAILEADHVYQIAFTCNCRVIRRATSNEYGVGTDGGAKIACRIPFIAIKPVSL